jgi:PleD family two-component response regulator
MSIGLALGGNGANGARGIEDLIGLADAALLDAKAEGRNQVTVDRSAA